MLTAQPLDAAFAMLDYLRVEAKATECNEVDHPLVYRATWSSEDVEHFVYVGSDNARHRYLVSDFGFRSRISEDFSIASLLRYGHPNFMLRAERPRPETSCMMSFSLERFFLAQKQVRPRLPLSVGPEEIARYVRVTVSDHLLPVIREITTSAKLVEFLSFDSEPCPWFGTNGIVRAAQIFALGQHVEIPRGILRALLAPRFRFIANSLVEPDLKSSLDEFLDRLTHDWRRHSSSVFRS